MAAKRFDPDCQRAAAIVCRYGTDELTSGQEYQIDSYGVRATKLGFATPNKMELHLFMDDGGKPGTEIDVAVIENVTVDSANYFPLSQHRPFVTAGRKYWVIASAWEAPDGINWNHSTNNDFVHAGISRENGGAWNLSFNVRDTVPSLRIVGSVVPEPSTWLLLMFGLSTTLCQRRR